MLSALSDLVASRTKATHCMTATIPPSGLHRPVPPPNPPPLSPPASTEQARVSVPAAIPNLGNVITPDDVSQKGTGKYIADYVNWCRVSQLLRDHAPGWQFHLRPAPDGSHVWVAPNGTGYLVGYFTDPVGLPTADFPQAVMNNSNGAVAVERIGARDVTDCHRRALCTCAAATFGLAWQLWAREPIEDPHREPEPQVRSIPAGTSVRLSPAVEATALRDAAAAIKASGLTADGLSALLLQFGNHNAASIAELAPNAIAVIPKVLAVPEKVEALNQGLHTVTGEPLFQAGDDPPLAWLPS